jgi:hypothetical protein
MLLTKKDKENDYRDVLIVISTDGTADIMPVSDINEERILGLGSDGDFSIPHSDVKAYTGRKGRIYVTPTDLEHVLEYKSIARLEQSTVLRQITLYESAPNEEAAKFELMKFLPWIFCFILILFVGFKH